MSTKHTPGPWLLEIRRDDTFAIWREGTGTIAETAGWTHEHKAEESANARLIAAAPELLDALVVAEPYLIPRVLGTGGDGETRVLPILRAAILKATGGQP